ncbi:Uncharacterised protein [Starkeya nomas]|uniref:Uncharacterized protein n=1 Tax=Starkeya nomas TaxID=2666134 RepID=A0A5S9NZL8_9HYPH|nr:Uncharacterised protein [Starkeya nomas]
MTDTKRAKITLNDHLSGAYIDGPIDLVSGPYMVSKCRFGRDVKIISDHPNLVMNCTFHEDTQRAAEMASFVSPSKIIN